MIPYVDETGKLHYTTYVKKGEMLYLREALSHKDPDNLYNYLELNGFKPEEYGVEHPLTEQYASYSRGDLIEELVKIKEELEAIYKMGVV